MGESTSLFIGIVGLLSASVLGTTAAGWGAITVPLLILAGVEPVTAISASLAAGVILPFLGGVAHWRIDNSRAALFKPLVIGGILGALTGTLVTPRLPGALLKLLIGVTTLAVGLFTWVNGRDHGGGDGKKRALGWIIPLIGMLGGFSSGAFGTGWGPIGVSLLVWVGIPPHTVVGSSLLARTVISLAASASYIVQMGTLRRDLFFPLLLSGSAGVYVGVFVSNRLSPRLMRKVIGMVVTLLGGLIIAKSL
jgi:uncharacterized membrane protein YfcA